MNIKVIKVTKNGKTGYLYSSNIFEGTSSKTKSAIVDNPWDARDYNSKDFEHMLEKDISHIFLPGKTSGAMSGVKVDSAHVVEIELAFKEVSIKEAWTPPELENKISDIRENSSAPSSDNKNTPN